jgi:hypothetical protein
VRATLRELAVMLASQPGAGSVEFTLEAPAPKTRAARPPAAAAKAAVKRAPKKK